MKKVAQLLLIVSVGLFVAPEILFAAKAVGATATVSINDPTPVYGETVTFTADATATPTYIYVECQHVSGTSYSYSVFDYTGEPYSDDVGLYAPNWPDIAASCLAEVVLYQTHGRQAVLATLRFDVAP